MMLRTLMALAKVDGRVCAFLEPIALYMAKDLHEPGDGGWLTQYPPPGRRCRWARAGCTRPKTAAPAMTWSVFTFGNGVPMSLRAARASKEQHGWSTRVVDLRWLVPLNEGLHRRTGADAKRILVVDEGRRSAGVGEGIITALVEAGLGATPLKARGRRRHLHPAGGRGLPGDSIGRRHRGRRGRLAQVQLPA
jgi:2-oxoisovalerate dehydrogenase E1 component